MLFELHVKEDSCVLLHSKLFYFKAKHVYDKIFMKIRVLWKFKKYF